MNYVMQYGVDHAASHHFFCCYYSIHTVVHWHLLEPQLCTAPAAPLISGIGLFFNTMVIKTSYFKDIVAIVGLLTGVCVCVCVFAYVSMPESICVNVCILCEQLSALLPPVSLYNNS